MIIVHRITPLIIGLLVALAYTLTAVFPSLTYFSVPFFLALVLLLAARLFKDKKTKEFWALLGSLLVFSASGFALFLFLESENMQIILALFQAIIVYFFTESAFFYYHLPAKYQAYSLEYLTMMMNVFSVFFIAAGFYALLMFLQPPLVLLALAFFVLSSIALATSLLLSKVQPMRTLVYTVSGALLLTELFAVISFLPTGFYTNAAIISIFFYTFLGLSRAHVLEKLTTPVIKRYVGLSVIMLALIIGTSRWF